MGSKRGWIGLAVLALAAVAGLAWLRGRSAGEGGESAEVVTEVAVHVGPVTRATLHRYVTAYGRVEPEPATAGRPPARADVGSQVGGVLVGIDCAEGRRVERGAALFRLDPRVAEVALDMARQSLEFAAKTYARQQALMAADGTSAKAVLQAEQDRDAARSEVAAAQTQLDLLTIRAPLAGTVVRVDAHLGHEVEAGVVLAEIVDLDRLVLSAAVPSREAALLKLGQRVEIGEQGATAGSLAFIGSDVDPATDTVRVRAALPAGAGFQPGQFLASRIVAEERRDCLAVPLDALVTRAEEGSWVMAVEGDKAVRKPVTGGLRDGGMVEVAGEGLAEGMKIVVDEAYSLPAETGIRIVGAGGPEGSGGLGGAGGSEGSGGPEGTGGPGGSAP
jgi:membrane fusion protein, multidrug efflux system